MTRVMVHPAAYETATQAVTQAFRLFPVDVQGRTVLIKPNVLRASLAEEGIVTHPAVVRAVVDEVESMGAATIIVGDNPGIFSYGANEEAFRRSGLMEAAKGYYRNIGNDSRTVPFNPRFLPEVSVSSAVLDADVVISVPKFKTHGLTVMTGALKNSYGYLPGAQKAKLHRIAGNAGRFHAVIVDVFRVRPPDLFIMDAVVGMEGNGPASPELRTINRIIASDNAVALDAVVATMMGLDPGRLPFLKMAGEKGLGDYDINAIEVLGDMVRLPQFRLPPLSGAANLEDDHIQAVLHGRTMLRPEAEPALCTGCGACIGQCPAGALSMGDRLPEVDRDACIACFCCQEICPEKAMRLQ